MSRKYKPDHIKKFMCRVAEMGCIICGAPAQLHHIRTTENRKSDLFVIPLCSFHHTDGPAGDSIHNGKFEFRSMHGSEWDLYAKVVDNVIRRLR